jgi:hypothetical protein
VVLLFEEVPLKEGAEPTPLDASELCTDVEEFERGIASSKLMARILLPSTG